MAKTTLLKPVSVYMTPSQYAGIEKAAMLDNRPVSNFLLTLGLERAEELGISPTWKLPAPLPRARLLPQQQKVSNHE